MPAYPSLIQQLAEMGIRPRKGLGQNFLVDPAHRARIVAAAALGPADRVLEVGAGPGVLTELLAQQAGRVVAVELDERLIPFLRQRFAAQPHVRIVQADILKLDVGRLMVDDMRPALAEVGAGGDPSILQTAPGYKVVANLPYYITGAAVHHLLETQPAPDCMVLTVQREVAERMVATPPHMSLLALGVQFYCVAGMVDRIPAGAFYPPPKVDSAAVRLDRRAQAAVPDVAPRDFFRVARAGFSQKRKQLRNALAGGMGLSPQQAEAWLRRAGIAPQRRAETLTIEDWGRLAREMPV